MWKNMTETDRPQIRIYYGACALQLTKVTDSHSEYVILTAFPWQKWLCECASVLRLCIRFLPLCCYCCRGSKACHSSMEITGLLIPTRNVLDFPLFSGSPSFLNSPFVGMPRLQIQFVEIRLSPETNYHTHSDLILFFVVCQMMF